MILTGILSCLALTLITKDARAKEKAKETQRNEALRKIRQSLLEAITHGVGIQFLASLLINIEPQCDISSTQISHLRATL